QHTLGPALLDLAELLQPGGERTIRDQLDVLEPDHLVLVVGVAELGVARVGVDDLRVVEADGLGHVAAPAQFEGLHDDLRVGPRRARAEQERVFELDAVLDDAQTRSHGEESNQKQTARSAVPAAGSNQPAGWACGPVISNHTGSVGSRPAASSRALASFIS